MRWTKKEKRKRIPDDNERRVITKFLFFPRHIDEEYRWFEKVSIEQYYREIKIHECRGSFGGDSFYCTGGKWYDIKFVDNRRR